jgi:hypothetical protein
MATLNLLKVPCNNNLKSHLLRQTISPFSATANSRYDYQYVCDLFYHRKSCNIIASLMLSYAASHQLWALHVCS